VTSDRYCARALHGEEKLVRYAKPGERTIVLNTAAYNLGQLVAGANLDEAEVEDVLLDAALACGLDEDRALDTIRGGLTAGKDNPRSVRPSIANREDALEEIARIADAADLAKWPGHKGKRKIRVLFASLTIAREVGGPGNVPLSTHRVCVAANTKNRALVQRALRELCEDGWLVRLTFGGPGHATRYKLRVPSHLSRDLDMSRSQAVTTHTQPRSLWPDYATPLETAVATPTHDAFHARGLDTTAWRIARFLIQRPGEHTQAETARELGVSRSTVWRLTKPPAQRSGRLTVGLLHRERVIERDDKARIRIATGFEVGDLERIARALSTLGEGATHRAEVRTLFVEQGWLTDDCRWIDTRTGEIRSQARWLLRRDESDGEGTAA
jgi:hypothetical protein